jgi:hypothetical protein
MDEAAFNETVERLKKVNGIISNLDPAIRAEAFELLAPYVTGGGATEAEASEGDGDAAAATRKASGGAVDYNVLIEKFESDKDYENAMLVLAIVYDRHGRGPMQLSHIKVVSEEFNLTVPERLDKFFGPAKRGVNKTDKKEVLRKQSDGWKITPSGEAWLKHTYGVTRGKKPLPAAAES